jgi:cytochrome b6-f complex iron-sulfur subunit
VKNDLDIPSGSETDRALRRRDFCREACHALSAVGLSAALGSALQGCGGPAAPSSVPPAASVNGSVVGGTITIVIDPSSALGSVGGGALVQTSAGRFLVARTGPDSFSALTATCTHRSCTINGFSDGRFICPCHGSNFDTSGQVLNGPASRPLRQYATRFAEGVLTITL